MRLVLLERTHRLDEREIRLAGDAPATVQRFHQRAMRGGQMRLTRESDIELALYTGEVEPAVRVGIERLTKLVHAPLNCTTIAETLSLQVPLSACFMSALQAPSGSLPVR